MPRPETIPADTVQLPAADVLVAAAGRAHWLTVDGELREEDGPAAARRAESAPPILCHGPATARRLNAPRFAAYDVLELFAFARPAAFCVPTAGGLASALGLAAPEDHAGELAMLVEAGWALLRGLSALPPRATREAATIAAGMTHGGWLWGPAVLRALGDAAAATASSGRSRSGLDVWNRLDVWSEHAPEPPPHDEPVSQTEARERLARLVHAGGRDAEARPEQVAYTEAASLAFGPREQAGAPNMILAEAGTGVGKTLGYIAPASVWSEKNGAAVWLSTFTKNLQRQIDQELDRLYPDPAEKARKAVVRKGRENYLCLLNFEEAVSRGAGRRGDAVALGLMARWARASRDGDMVGGDFPSWLTHLVGRARTLELTDQRGECVYSACAHYQKCFIEKAVRRARRADMVIANHALVMVQAAMSGGDERDLPLRYVFDEGHHVFAAADGAFSAHLCGTEAAELRRWIRGGEGGRRSRARGLEKRIGDLLAGHDRSLDLLRQALAAASQLPGEGWLKRVSLGEGYGPCERFLAMVRKQVLTRCANPDSRYALEAATGNPVEGLPAAAESLRTALDDLARPLRALVKALARQLDDEAADLDTSTRVRIEAAARGLQRRVDTVIAAWSAMLGDLREGAPPQFVDWFSLDRSDGRDMDVGFRRHWLDPTIPFARTVLERAHGVLVTSATLRDRDRADADDWTAAEVRTGTVHLPLPARRTALPSPFDYGAATRVLVVTDVRRDDPAQVAAACRELFLAAGGGGLGLFTAIWRLRAVHKRIAETMEAAGIALHAQHVDAMDTSTLVDIFRAEEDACLLGTDAVRDGIDVPGRSLRLIVFDRVPWPRPDLLHRARKEAFGGSAYDDMLTRLKLKQAYGRLVRRSGDRGVFVMLDAMLPSRLLTAFPESVEVRRIGLAEAVAATREFLLAPND